MRNCRSLGTMAWLLGSFLLGSVQMAQAAPLAPPLQLASAQAAQSSPSPHALWTFVFLESLALERQTDPSPLCTQLYVDLDRALDRLVDTPDWQHLAWQFSRCGIYETLEAMQNEGCNDDLSVEVQGESAACAAWREQGRRQLYQLEQTERGQAIIHGPAMRSFDAHLAIGLQTGCLTRPGDAAR